MSLMFQRGGMDRFDKVVPHHLVHECMGRRGPAGLVDLSFPPVRRQRGAGLPAVLPNDCSKSNAGALPVSRPSRAVSLVARLFSGRRSASRAAGWAGRAVLVPPRFDENPSFSRGPENLPGQEPFAQPGVARSNWHSGIARMVESDPACPACAPGHSEKGGGPPRSCTKSGQNRMRSCAPTACSSDPSASMAA